MCEILLRVVDKVGTDPYNDAKLLKAGDVVCVQDDGWPWGREELKNPDWRIVKIPSLAVTTATSFLGPEFDIDPAHPSRVLRRRAFSIDLSHGSLPTPFKSWLADSTRASPTKTIAMNGTQLLSLKKAKTRLTDPNVI